MASSSSTSSAPTSIQTGSTEVFEFQIRTAQFPCNQNSPIFSFGGYKWSLNCDISTSKDVCLTLLLSVDKPVKATIGLCLLHKNGKCSPIFQRISCEFPPLTVCNAMVRQVQRNQLDDHLINDILTVHCFIFIYDQEIEPLHCLQPNGLVENLGNLLTACQDISDVTFEVDGQTFHAHRLLLAARSPVFKAGLYGEMAEAKNQCIKIEDMNSEVFGLLLRYIYTDFVEPADSYLTQHLLVAADRYALNALRIICEGRLCKELTVDTVLSSLALADHHNCDKLLDACIDFIASTDNYLDLTLTREYMGL